ncbi:MAG: TIGR04076 family protein [Theionarchaea archaeon]|nr:TIGR04076 family protein [Theionarchaea archaeon]
MKDIHEVKITVLKRFHPSEVFEESPVTPSEPMEVCGLLREGDVFSSKGGSIPVEFPCTSAWIALYPYVRVLSFGGNMPWIKEKGLSITCCPDGLRPVVFKLERIEE